MGHARSNVVTRSGSCTRLDRPRRARIRQSQKSIVTSTRSGRVIATGPPASEPVEGVTAVGHAWHHLYGIRRALAQATTAAVS
jgi:hypothetical protein